MKCKICLKYQIYTKALGIENFSIICDDCVKKELLKTE
jgi:hypothetical protein